MKFFISLMIVGCFSFVLIGFVNKDIYLMLVGIAGLMIQFFVAIIRELENKHK